MYTENKFHTPVFLSFMCLAVWIVGYPR